ncbi:hypothetical protein M2390_000290 [Mycetocola sp. BIGb0189]|uniref:hypothetical protein n=1 Tax=Mycetocola sp. BIGb0189 TaxID=2940604 RepID=UPI0021686245|nr:hypothetical protein [Mycetocola sp. BIGb0189]MCS4275132.1 hypothetical protein [Mycetocola sp. BIGb0189]
MKDQLEHERENTARISVAAVEVLQLYMQGPGWAEAYARITDRYKQAFMAFLLLPGLARTSAKNVVTTFEAGHSVKGGTVRKPPSDSCRNLGGRKRSKLPGRSTTLMSLWTGTRNVSGKFSN